MGVGHSLARHCDGFFVEVHMRIGRIAVITVAASMVSISAFAQSSEKAPKPSMSLVGCLIGESDYKRAHEGKGNSASASVDDEFVLVDASESSSAAAPAASGSCTETGNGKAYRLVGKHKRELKPFIGRRIAITGAFDKERDAKIAAGDKKSQLPPEVEVASFREVTASPSPASAKASAAPAPPKVAPAPALNPAPEATDARNETPSRKALPRTASNLPLIGLVGLISLGAAFALRLARPRMS
jgi:hypothetical protein